MFSMRMNLFNCRIAARLDVLCPKRTKDGGKLWFEKPTNICFGPGKGEWTFLNKNQFTKLLCLYFLLVCAFCHLHVFSLRVYSPPFEFFGIFLMAAESSWRNSVCLNRIVNCTYQIPCLELVENTNIFRFLGPFAKLRKATLSFVMSVRSEQFVSHWRIFMKSDIWIFFRKSVEKIQVSLKSDKNKGYFTWIFMYSSANISLSSS